MRPCFVILAGALAFSAASGQVALVTVGADPACTHPDLQSGLNATLAGSDALTTVRIARNQVYTNVAVQVPANNVIVEGGYDDCLDAIPSGSTTLDGTGGATAPVLTLLGSTDRPEIVLRNLGIRNGDAIGGYGGGIHVDGDAEVWIENSSISASQAGFGGGIAVQPSKTASVVLDEESVVFGNVGGTGGGIYCENRAFVFVYGGVFGNQAHHGGGIHATDCRVAVWPVNPQNSSRTVGNAVTLNVATGNGGGIYADLGSEVQLTGVGRLPARVSINEAAGSGGGLYLDGAGLNYVSAHVVDNQAGGDGGGIYLAGDTAFIGRGERDCVADGRCALISTNSAPAGKGGAIAVDHGTLNLRGVWLTDNRSAIGSALSGVAASVIDVRNSVIVGNRTAVSVVSADDSDVRLVFDTLADNEDQLAEVQLKNGSLNFEAGIVRERAGVAPVNSIGTAITASCLMTHATAGLPTRADIVIDDPLFVDAAADNYHLHDHSPAIDFCDAPTGTWAFERDIDGDLRGEDAPQAVERFGIHDLGADAYSERVFADGFEAFF